MTRIVEFEIVGLAGRDEPVSYSLDDDVNIFFGQNGSGKTSLLKILYSALRNETELLRRVAFESASVTFYSHTDQRTVTRRITSDVVASNPPIQSTVQYGVSGAARARLLRENRSLWESDPETESQPFAILYLPITRLVTELPGTRRYVESDDLSSVETAIDDLFAEHITQSWWRYSNQLLSEVTKVQQSGLAAILTSLFMPGEQESRVVAPLETQTAYRKATAFLERQGARLPGDQASFASLYQDDERLRSVVADIDRIEQQIESAEKPRRELQSLVDQFISGSKHIQFGHREIDVTVPDGEIPLAALSSGEKQLLRILVETANASRNTIVVDEPELSMHIDWQRQLITAMRTVNPSAQIIVATHSPEIMAFAPDEKIHRL